MYGLIFSFLYYLALLSLFCGFIIPLMMLTRNTALKRASGKVRYYLWLPILILALIPLRISAPVSTAQPSAMTLEQEKQGKDIEQIPTAVLPSYASEGTENTLKNEDTPLAKEIIKGFINNASSFVKSNIKTIVAAVFSIWLCGFLIITFKINVGYVKAKKYLMQYSYPADGKYTALIDVCKGIVGVRRNVGLRTVKNNCILSPCLAGFINPIIFVPQSDMDRSESELRLVFIHELIHIKRKDILYNAFSGIVCALHWFNPLFKILSRKRYEDCEFSCDEKVLELMGKQRSREYVNMIFNMMSSNNAGSWHSTIKTPDIALFLEGDGDINFIKRRFSNMKKQCKRGATLIAVIFTLASVVFSTLFISSCGEPKIDESLSTHTSRFANPIIEQAVYEYYGLDRNDEITDEQLSGITSIDIQFVSMPNQLSSDGSVSSVFADITVNGVKLGLLPQYVSKDRYENTFNPALTELDRNYTDKVNYNRICAYYLLLDKDNPKWTDEDKTRWNIDYLNEFITKFPMLNQSPLYILDPTANEREKQLLISILNQAGLCDDLIVQDTFVLTDIYMMGNCTDIKIQDKAISAESEMPESIILSDINATAYELVEVKQNYGNSLFKYPTVEPKERETPTGDNYFVEFNNLSLQSALLEYFVLPQGQTNMELTKEHIDLITSIKVSVNKKATDVINADEFYSDSYYLVYEINGQDMGIIPPRIDRGTFETRFINCNVKNEEDTQKLLAYYLVKDPSLLEDEKAIEELLLTYPDCKDNPYYMLDPTMSEQECIYLLKMMVPSPYIHRHIYFKNTPYDTSDIALFPNLVTFELSDELK